EPSMPTRLTQARRRSVRGHGAAVSKRVLPAALRVCRDCGAPLQSGRTFCARCGIINSKERFPQVAAQGRHASHTPDAEARRAKTQRRNALTQHAWSPSDQPAWLTERTYAERIQPRLATINSSNLASALGVSRGYAMSIASGQRRPHPRHWLNLATLAGLSREKR